MSANTDLFKREMQWEPASWPWFPLTLLKSLNGEVCAERFLWAGTASPALVPTLHRTGVPRS